MAGEAEIGVTQQAKEWQALLAATRNRERGTEQTLLQSPPEGCLGFGFLPSRTMRVQVSVILSHPICGTLL